MKTPFTIENLKSSKVAAINPHLFEKGYRKTAGSKYRNKKIEIDGIVFDSLKESRRYLELRARKVKGEISKLNVHVLFELSVCKYEADFTYVENDRLVVEDVKSSYTRKLAVYRMKKKLMLSELNIEIHEV